MAICHRLVALAFALAGYVAFAQIVGTVESVSGNVIHVKTGLSRLLRRCGNGGLEGQDVLRSLACCGRRCHSLPGITQMPPAGLSRKRWQLNITNVFAVITKVADGEFEVFLQTRTPTRNRPTRRKARLLKSARRRYSSPVPRTISPRITGRDVQVVGLVLGNGQIQATRVTVCD